MKSLFFLYIYSIDIYGRHEVIKGKPFDDLEKATDIAKHYCSMPGFHAQVIQGTSILYNQ